MDIKKLNDDISVSSQLWLTDLAELARQGFKSVINNRPDDEAADQPSSAAVREAANAVGLTYRHVPVVPGNITAADVASFRRAQDELAGPTVAFCRTGKRAATLWALCESNDSNRDAIRKRCADAGHDISELNL